MNKHTLIAVNALVALILMNACTTTNDVVSDGFISKRKYTKGYFVQLPLKQDMPDVKFIVKKPENKSKDAFFDIQEEKITASANNNEPAILSHKHQTLLVSEKKIISAIQSIKQLYGSGHKGCKYFQ